MGWQTYGWWVHPLHMTTFARLSPISNSHPLDFLTPPTYFRNMSHAPEPQNQVSHPALLGENGFSDEILKTRFTSASGKSLSRPPRRTTESAVVGSRQRRAKPIAALLTCGGGYEVSLGHIWKYFDDILYSQSSLWPP